MEIMQKLVKQSFSYKDGNLYWVKSVGKTNSKNGNIAGYHPESQRYGKIGFNNKKYTTHQLVFLYFHGYIPKMIDHIDRDTRNNRIENLREATKQQNIWNSGKRKNCTSKYKGVSIVNQGKRYLVKIRVNGKTKKIGVYDNEVEAATVYNEIAKSYFGEFAFLNELP